MSRFVGGNFRLVGLMPVRNEGWCLGLTLQVALKWCDEVVVLLHSSTDNSGQLAMGIATLTERVTVLATDDTKWDEMRHRQAMLEIARTRARPDARDGPSATHIALVDADELLTANLVDEVQGWVQRYHQQDLVQRRLELPLYNLRGGMDKYHANGVWGNRWTTAAFQDFQQLHWSGDRFHHREPMGVQLVAHRPVEHGQGGILHLWGADERRLRAKHALYKITERIRWPQKPVAEIEKYYNQAIYSDTSHMGNGRDSRIWTFADVPPAWLEGYEDLMRDHLHLDAEPWQEAESRRLVELNGREQFRGLDLFGVV